MFTNSVLIASILFLNSYQIEKINTVNFSTQTGQNQHRYISAQSASDIEPSDSTIKIKEFRFSYSKNGKSKVSERDLFNLTKKYIGQRLTMEALNKVRDEITKYYLDLGLSNYSANLYIQNNKVFVIDKAVITFTIVNSSDILIDSP